MKKNLSTSVRAIIYGAVLALAFTGCKNFIQGEGVKKQIEERIAYANATPYEISVEEEKGTGAVKKPADGVIAKKASDVFDISFYPDSDFAFISWEIYDKTTGNLIPNGEYLKIARPGDEETTCEVVKVPEDPNVKLILKPVVVERPQIISATLQLMTETVPLEMPAFRFCLTATWK